MMMMILGKKTMKILGCDDDIRKENDNDDFRQENYDEFLGNDDDPR